VVIAIIAILAAMLLPSLTKAKFQRSRPGRNPRLVGMVILFCLSVSARSQDLESFDPSPEWPPNLLAAQPDGKILIGGQFNTVAGTPATNLARLDAEGSLDTGFSPPLLWVRSLAVQADGKILVAQGWWTPRGSLVRLNSDGSLDAGFNGQAASDSSASVIAQPDGKILVIGRIEPQAAYTLARLNEDGTRDERFAVAVPAGGAGLELMALQPDGKILVAGEFTSLAGQARTNLARLNADGTLDAAFEPGGMPGSWLPVAVDGLAVLADGGIVVAERRGPGLRLLDANGKFLKTIVAKYALNLGLQADGKLLVNGQWRFNADGAPDPTFTVKADNEICAVLLQPDGRMVVSGKFTKLADEARQWMGRFQNTDPAADVLSYERPTISWLRGGASPEFCATFFEYSRDGANWTKLGQGRRVPGGWALGAAAIPAGATIRARGLVASTGPRLDGNSSSWIAERTLVVPAALEILRNKNLGYRDGRFGFDIAGPAGREVVVEGSRDLLNWTSLASYTLGAEPAHFTDVNSAMSDSRCYRVWAR
jgi:uncharacterized delta-60 repeat protein